MNIEEMPDLTTEEKALALAGHMVTAIMMYRKRFTENVAGNNMYYTYSVRDCKIKITTYVDSVKLPEMQAKRQKMVEALLRLAEHIDALATHNTFPNHLSVEKIEAIRTLLT